MFNEQSAIRWIIDNFEGGLSTYVQDAGGITKYGISSRFHPEVDVKNMTLDQAIAIYVKEYVVPSRAKEFRDPVVGVKYLDICINAGMDDGARIVQESMNFFVPSIVAVDSKMGDKTLSKVNEFLTGPLRAQAFVYAMCARQFDMYYRRVSFIPGQEKFSIGWARRASTVPPRF